MAGGAGREALPRNCLPSKGSIMARIVLAIATLLFLVEGVPAILDPHDESNPDRCRSCHTADIADAEPGSGDYHLLAETIDGVCLVCHLEEDCCVIGQDHQEKIYLGMHSHPTDIERGEIQRIHLPRTLPLFDKKITCNTCHSHERQKPRDYKMVRLAVVSDLGVDWTPLCSDCHEDY